MIRASALEVRFGGARAVLGGAGPVFCSGVGQGGRPGGDGAPRSVRAGGDGQRGEEGVRRGWIVWEKAFIAWSISILAHAGLGMAMFSLGLYISVTALLNASVAVSCIAASTSLILHC
jgi:hypothetical protein